MPDGELDLVSCSVLVEALTMLDEDVTLVVCDMSWLRFLDILGLHALWSPTDGLHER